MKKNAPLTALLALSAALIPSSLHAAAITPLPVTGWAEDMIINNGSGSYNKSITGTIDSGGGNIEGGTFAAADTYPVQPDGTATAIAGLTNAVYTSATSTAATFQFGDFNASNSLLLTPNVSGTLTLVTPAKMTTLSLFGTSGNGPTSGLVTVNFTDSTSSDYPLSSGITADWFNFSGSNATVALAIGHRESNHNEDGYTTIFYEQNSVISIYESDIALSAADQAKTVSSVTITNSGGGGVMAVMAISSDAAPAASTDLKITSSSFNFTTGMVTLNFSSVPGTIYRATHSSTLNGTDWAAVGDPVTASGATSTLTVPFTKGVKDFFRVEITR